MPVRVIVPVAVEFLSPKVPIAEPVKIVRPSELSPATTVDAGMPVPDSAMPRKKPS